MAIPKFRNPTSVLVTGGSSGIGKAIAIDAVDRGCKVFLMARDQSKLDSAIAEVRSSRSGSHVAGISASVTESDALAKVVAAAEAQHGPIDLLVNSAGVSVPGYFEDLSIDEFANQMEVNYLGTVRAIQAVLPGMKSRGYGWIVNVSSVAGFKGFFGYTAYCGSKFAITGFSEALRSEFERHNIGVTLLCPPDTRTPMLDQEEANKPIETKRLSASGSLLEPEDVSRALWSGLSRNKFWITPGFSANSLRIGNRFTPWLVDWIVRRTIRAR